jgi:hypothetical protein
LSVAAQTDVAGPTYALAHVFWLAWQIDVQMLSPVYTVAHKAGVPFVPQGPGGTEVLVEVDVLVDVVSGAGLQIARALPTSQDEGYFSSSSRHPRTDADPSHTEAQLLSTRQPRPVRRAQSSVHAAVSAGGSLPVLVPVLVPVGTLFPPLLVSYPSRPEMAVQAKGARTMTANT